MFMCKQTLRMESNQARDFTDLNRSPFAISLKNQFIWHSEMTDNFKQYHETIQVSISWGTVGSSGSIHEAASQEDHLPHLSGLFKNPCQEKAAKPHGRCEEQRGDFPANKNISLDLSKFLELYIKSIIFQVSQSPTIVYIKIASELLIPQTTISENFRRISVSTWILLPYFGQLYCDGPYIQ